MDAYKIEGGYPLKGAVKISGSKNASLPCLIASLLTDEPVELSNVPRLRDTATAIKLLECLGKACVWTNSLVITESKTGGSGKAEKKAPYELVKQMRASVLVCGPLLARWGKAQVALPGGCALGLRPIDIHLDGFKAMGAAINVYNGYVHLRRPQSGLKAVTFRLRFPSVGATENLILAAALTPGKTRIINAAREPEIKDLANMLTKMGARTQGAGTSTITIEGSKNLHGTKHRVIPDRLEAASFLAFAACVKGSRVSTLNCEPEHLSHWLASLKKAGLGVETSPSSITLNSPKNFRPKPLGVTTKPYPGFVTDLQPLWMAIMAQALGSCQIRERVFENRFLTAAELNRMGAQISVKADRALVNGVSHLHGAPVMASDIRAGISLVAGALAAKGTTVISRIYHIDRGYENLEQKLLSLGARISRFNEF